MAHDIDTDYLDEPEPEPEGVSPVVPEEEPEDPGDPEELDPDDSAPPA